MISLGRMILTIGLRVEGVMMSVTLMTWALMNTRVMVFQGALLLTWRGTYCLLVTAILMEVCHHGLALRIIRGRRARASSKTRNWMPWRCLKKADGIVP